MNAEDKTPVSDSPTGVETAAGAAGPPVSLLVDKLCLYYGEQQALKDVDMRIPLS